MLFLLLYFLLDKSCFPLRLFSINCYYNQLIFLINYVKFLKVSQHNKFFSQILWQFSKTAACSIKCERKYQQQMVRIEPYYLNRGIFPHGCVQCNCKDTNEKERMDGRTDGHRDSVSERSQGDPKPPL